LLQGRIFCTLQQEKGKGACIKISKFTGKKSGKQGKKATIERGGKVQSTGRESGTYVFAK